MEGVTHFEIPVANPSRATSFYSGVFGWSVNKWDGEDYWIVHTGEVDEDNMPEEKGVINGAFYPKLKESQTTIVTNVRDIDAALKKALAKGGKIIKKKEKFPGMGIYAQIEDTEGNIIGVWQNNKK